MVDPLSITLGIGVSVVGILASLGLYLAGRSPDHIINMRDIAAYHRHQSAIQALAEDVDDSEGDA